MPGNGNGNEGEHGPEAEQSVDDALVALVATIGEGTCGIVDTVRDVPALVEAACWNTVRWRAQADRRRAGPRRAVCQSARRRLTGAGPRLLTAPCR